MPGVIDAGIEGGDPKNLGLKQHRQPLLNLHGRRGDIERADPRQLQRGREIDRQAVQHLFAGRIGENARTFRSRRRQPAPRPSPPALGPEGNGLTSGTSRWSRSRAAVDDLVWPPSGQGAARLALT